jgi:hypothetical protein
VILNTSPWLIAAENSEPLSDTKIVHQPMETSLAGLVVPLTATVEDSAGVEVVRVYFKSTVGTIFYYIPMIHTKDNGYSGVLPAPAADAGEIQYLILVKNKNGVVVKSQQYQTVIAENQNKSAADKKQESIQVYSESPYASKYIIGFESGYDFQVADPSEKYGVVAGLYNPESVSWISTDAVSGGTVDESSDGSWNPWLIGGAAVAGIAVVAVALGGGSSGGGGNTTPEPPADDTPTPPADTDNEWKLTSYEYTSACTSGINQIQTVTCTAANIVESVSPSSFTVAVPDGTSGTCKNETIGGLADVFDTGQTCDAQQACENYSPADLTSKDCQATSITIVRDSGKHTQTWTKQ